MEEYDFDLLHVKILTGKDSGEVGALISTNTIERNGMIKNVNMEIDDKGIMTLCGDEVKVVYGNDWYNYRLSPKESFYKKHSFYEKYKEYLNDDDVYKTTYTEGVFVKKIHKGFSVKSNVRIFIPTGNRVKYTITNYILKEFSEL